MFWSWGYGGKVTIYLRYDKGNGENFFEGGGSREMLNDRLYPINHVSKSQNLKISKSQNGFIENGQLLDYSFNIIIIYIYIIIILRRRMML